MLLRITGYSDKYSVHPGEEVKFFVNSEKNETYEAQLVRLIHGDTNPEGPGYKEEEISASCNGSYQGKNQVIHGGSYVFIPQHENLNVESFTLQAYIFPTTPDKGRQGIITKWNETEKTGYGLFIDENGCLSVEIGDGSQVTKVTSEKKLLTVFSPKNLIIISKRNIAVIAASAKISRFNNDGFKVYVLTPIANEEIIITNITEYWNPFFSLSFSQNFDIF